MVFTQTVDYTWNGKQRDDLQGNQKPVTFTLEYDSAKEELIIKVQAPFFNDCPIPPSKGETGYGTYELWNYEVAEIFIEGKGSHYTEVELSPFGNFLILTFEAPRKATNDDVCLPTPPSTDIAGNTRESPLALFPGDGDTFIRSDGHWTSTLRLPKKFLPAPMGDSKSMFSFNCYHIHGQGDNRRYYAAFPDTDTDEKAGPDFHRLQYFQELPDDAVFGAEGVKQLRA